MSLTSLAAGVLLMAITAYSTAGGVDFGAGIWDLLAGRGRQGERARALIDHAMAPVWEVNNVWLVLAIVLCWTGFPALFEAAFSSLYPLFTLALIGLVLRGAFFAFRHVSDQRSRPLADLVFGISSVLTPFFFAASLGAIASGRVGAVDVLSASFGPMPIAFGAVSVAATAFSGASFLVGDARRHSPDLVDYFRHRTLAAALALIVIGTLALAVIGTQRPELLAAMFRPPAVVVTLAAMIATPVAAGLVLTRRYVLYRVLTVVTAGSLVVAWGTAQAPYLLPGRLTIDQAAAPGPTLGLLLLVAAGVVLVIGPAIGLLVYLDQRSLLESPHP